MINGRIMNKHLKKAKDKRPSETAQYFSPYQDDWYYQSTYSQVEKLPKDLPDDQFEDLLTAACYARSDHGPGDESLCSHKATSKEPKLHPKQMELLLDEVHDQFDHQANKPEERDIAREMCQDLLDKHDEMSNKTTYIDPPEGWKYGFPKPLPSDVEDILAWLIAEGYPQSTMDLYGDAFTYRILDSEE